MARFMGSEKFNVDVFHSELGDVGENIGKLSRKKYRYSREIMKERVRFESQIFCDLMRSFAQQVVEGNQNNLVNSRIIELMFDTYRNLRDMGGFYPYQKYDMAAIVGLALYTHNKQMGDFCPGLISDDPELYGQMISYFPLENVGSFRFFDGKNDGRAKDIENFWNFMAHYCIPVGSQRAIEDLRISPNARDMSGVIRFLDSHFENFGLDYDALPVDNKGKLWKISYSVSGKNFVFCDSVETAMATIKNHPKILDKVIKSYLTCNKKINADDLEPVIREAVRLRPENISVVMKYSKDFSVLRAAHSLNQNAQQFHPLFDNKLVAELLTEAIVNGWRTLAKHKDVIDTFLSVNPLDSRDLQHIQENMDERDFARFLRRFNFGEPVTMKRGL